MKTRTHKKGGKMTKTKRARNFKGGKTFASSSSVKLNYNGADVNCDVCRNNNYTEVIGAIEKSKVRSGIGHFFFGETAEILDNTSIIMYTCNTCGLCKVIRNKDPLAITATNL